MVRFGVLSWLLALPTPSAAAMAPVRDVLPQTITVHLTGGLAASHVTVWSTNLWSSHPSRLFMHQTVIKPSNGTFSYTIKPVYMVSFTSTHITALVDGVTIAAVVNTAYGSGLADIESTWSSAEFNSVTVR